VHYNLIKNFLDKTHASWETLEMKKEYGQLIHKFKCYKLLQT
jgi:hypothetical protein